MLVTNHINTVSEEELHTIAREVFKEDPEQIAGDIANLVEWIKTTPHMKNTRQDDQFLRMFFRGCNYNLAATKDKLDMFFTVRSLLPAWFDNWDPHQEQLQDILSAGVFLPLRGYDKQGRYVILVRTGHVIPTTMTVDDCWKVFIMIFALALEGNLQANTKGLVFLLDEEKITISHTFMLTPSTMKRLMMVFQEAYPMDNDVLIDMSLLYFLNLPKILKTFFNLFLSLLNEKYKKILKIHSSNGLDILKDDLGEEILPEEYGGTNTSVAELTEFWKAETIAQSQWLMNQTKMKTDESQRIGKSKIESKLSCSIM